MAADKHVLSDILAPSVAVLAPMDLATTDAIKRLMLAHPGAVELQIGEGHSTLTMSTESAGDMIDYLYSITEMVSTREDREDGTTILRIDQFNWRSDR